LNGPPGHLRTTPELLAVTLPLEERAPVTGRLHDGWEG
jgi:hypothetical protein